MLELREVSAGYRPDEWILKGLSLTLPEGGWLAVLGQNGSGKSTLSKAIMGLAPYVKGDILFNGERLNGLKPWQMAERGIAYFFQGGRVFPNLTVAENLRVAGQRLSKTEWQRQYNRIVPHFELLQRTDRLGLNAGYLSGGERHQLALAMTLIACPEVKLLIADEPSAGVAEKTSLNIFGLLKNQLDKNISLLLIEQSLKIINNLFFNQKTLILK